MSAGMGDTVVMKALNFINSGAYSLPLPTPFFGHVSVSQSSSGKSYF